MVCEEGAVKEGTARWEPLKLTPLPAKILRNQIVSQEELSKYLKGKEPMFPSYHHLLSTLARTQTRQILKDENGLLQIRSGNGPSCSFRK